MRRFFIEYSNIVGYTITGFVFGLSFFLLFVNFYHYETNSVVFYQDAVLSKRFDSIDQKIKKSRENISSINVNQYNGDIDKVSILNFYSKLDSCVTRLDSIYSDFDKKQFSVRDVYDLLLLYKNNIINDCVVVQLYDLDKNINIEPLTSVKPFIKMNANSLIDSVSYVKKNMENNSSYSFSSKFMKDNIFEITRDSYIEILDSYEKSINFVYELTLLYRGYLEG